MKHVILVGACYLDTILTVPHYPEEDSKLRATALQLRRGGNCPNSLEVLAQLLTTPPSPTPPLRLHLVSTLPDASSPATRNILSSFDCGSSSNGDGSGGDGKSGGIGAIDFSRCLYRAGHDAPASSYIIRSSGGRGSRTIVNYNDLPEMTVGEFEGVVEGFVREGEVGGEGKGEGCWWHFEGRIPETTLQCIRHLRWILPGSTISVEVEKPGREGLVELAAEADVVFYSRSWAESRGHTSPEHCLRAEAASSKASLMLCTWGEQGAGALSLPGGEYMHHAATRSGESISVVDTIGAGDTFVAGMLYALHADAWSWGEKLAFAVGLATRKVQREGFAGLVHVP
ncbi:Ketohexokinase [Staphylotrichum tortipilum]|uniref:Ketohexokinase n=1 Tax=Staphylotrichum tortipilum TaxID=2831512 RepID=A0AAN6MQM2_9PEZI|nr:Ketohexokinase [Staphylotrichum longicolle]